MCAPRQGLFLREPKRRYSAICCSHFDLRLVTRRGNCLVTTNTSHLPYGLNKRPPDFQTATLPGVLSKDPVWMSIADQDLSQDTTSSFTLSLHLTNQQQVILKIQTSIEYFRISQTHSQRPRRVRNQQLESDWTRPQWQRVKYSTTQSIKQQLFISKVIGFG